MRSNIATGIGCDVDRVNVKGKTNDGFGPEGDGRGDLGNGRSCSFEFNRSWSSERRASAAGAEPTDGRSECAANQLHGKKFVKALNALVHGSSSRNSLRSSTA